MTSLHEATRSYLRRAEALLPGLVATVSAVLAVVIIGFTTGLQGRWSKVIALAFGVITVVAATIPKLLYDRSKQTLATYLESLKNKTEWSAGTAEALREAETAIKEDRNRISPADDDRFFLEILEQMMTQKQLERLTPLQRRILRKCLVDGKRARTIAEEEGIPIEKVHEELLRAFEAAE